MKGIERLVEQAILASRWILVVFYLGLALSLAVYAASFGLKLFDFLIGVAELQEADALLKILGLIDAALVASLVVMVMISGYENFVSRFDDRNQHLTWLGKIDSSSLKIKVASTIVAISSIHLLQVFLNVNQYQQAQLMWLTLIHLTFVVSALLLAVIDRVMVGTEHSKAKAED